MKRFRPQAHHWVAAPFLLIAGFFLIAGMVDLFTSDLTKTLMALAITLWLIVLFSIPGYLAWSRRWDEFVKVVLGFSCLILFSLLGEPLRELAEQVEGLRSLADDWPALHGVWVVVLRFSPFFVAYGVYHWLHRPIIRLMERWMPADVDAKKARPLVGAPEAAKGT